MHPKSRGIGPKVPDEYTDAVAENVDALTAAVAAELRAYRAASQMTIDELAERSTISSRTLKRLLAAERDIDVRVLDLLSGPLRFEPHELMARAHVRAERDRRDAGEVA